jgi:hypothetical protein
MKVIQLPISNTSDEPMTVFLEPLCLDYSLKPGQRIQFRIRCEDETGYVELDWGDNRVLTVWLEGSAEDWPQATVDGVGPVEMGYQRELATWYPVPTADPPST